MKPESSLPGRFWIHLKGYKWIEELHEEGCVDLVGQTATYKGVEVRILDAELDNRRPKTVHLKLRRIDVEPVV